MRSIFAAILLIMLMFMLPSRIFAAEHVTLNSGYKMPVLGLGTWTLNNSEAEDCVYFAIKSGYRLIDTARYYRNERGVGRGVKRAISEGLVKREELFITSKILPGGDSDSEIENSLRDLDLDYVDLMLIHQPGYNDEQAYHAIERAVKSGKVRSLGISNYYTRDDFDRITRNASIMPAIIQNENHVLYQNFELQNYVRKFGIYIESWYPFGGRGNTQKIFANRVIQEIAKSHAKTPAQIILRWNLQSGYIAIPGSRNHAHILENFAIFDFELTEQDLQKIRNIHQDKRFENW